MTPEQLNVVRERLAKVLNATSTSEFNAPVLISYSPTDIQSLLAEVDRLREALKFYADKKNWEHSSDLWIGNHSFRDPECLIDRGQRAREVLR